MLLYINNNLQSSFNDFFYMNKDIHEYITGYPNDILKMSTNVVQSVSFVALGFLYSSHTIDIDISSINQGSLASEHRRISSLLEIHLRLPAVASRLLQIDYESQATHKWPSKIQMNHFFKYLTTRCYCFEVP